MKSKIIYLILTLVLVTALVLTSCGTKTTQTTTSTSTAKTTSGNWFSSLGIPKYGGTITTRLSSDPTYFDPYFRSASGGYVETLAMRNWALDRAIWDFKASFCPIEYFAPLLAESWEQTDSMTATFKIRQGVHWWNKSPVNGRELTADDVAYSFNRILGLGSGFTERSTFVRDAQYNTIVSITATDKYTVVFKFNTASLDNLYNLLSDFYVNSVVPHEVVEKYGDVNNWENFVGTGPWMLEDFTSGTSLTYARNQNYWGYDERYPKNRLPYADEVKTLVIPDVATAMSALRTGKIDIMEAIPWQQAQSLSTTNPELIQVTVPVQQSNSLDFRNDKEPFTDIRVRKALNMAIDRNTIAKSYYGGIIEGTPFGLVGLKGYYTPFDQWPSDVKEGYTFNPSGAKELLAAAGYPQGFKTNVVASSTYDVDLLQAIKSYFLDVGVDMEINVMDNTSYSAFINARKHDQINATVSTAMLWEPSRCLTRRYSTHSSNSCFNNDAAYDQLVDRFSASFDEAERKRLVIEANDYALAKYWAVHLLPQVNYVIYQPRFKGYSGEDMTFSKAYYYARFWIDQD